MRGPGLPEWRHYGRLAERPATKVERLLPDSSTLRFDARAKMRRDERLEGAGDVLAVGIEDFEALIHGVVNDQVAGLGTGQHRRQKLTSTKRPPGATLVPPIRLALSTARHLSIDADSHGGCRREQEDAECNLAQDHVICPDSPSPCGWIERHLRRRRIADQARHD